ERLLFDRLFLLGEGLFLELAALVLGDLWVVLRGRAWNDREREPDGHRDRERAADERRDGREREAPRVAPAVSRSRSRTRVTISARGTSWDSCFARSLSCTTPRSVSAGPSTTTARAPSLSARRSWL